MIISIRTLPLLNTKHKKFNNEVIAAMPFPNSYDENVIGITEVYLGLGKNKVLNKYRQFKLIEQIDRYIFAHIVEEREDGYYLSSTHVKSPKIIKQRQSAINNLLVPILDHKNITEDIWKSQLLFRSAFHNDNIISESLVYDACKNILQDFATSKMQTFTPTSKWMHDFNEINDLIDDAHIESGTVYELSNAIDRIIYFTFGKPTYLDEVERISSVIRNMDEHAKISLEKVLPKGFDIKVTKNDEYIEEQINEELENSSNIDEIMNISIHNNIDIVSLIVNIIESGIDRIDITLKKDSKKDKLYITNGICCYDNNHNGKYTVTTDLNSCVKLTHSNEDRDITSKITEGLLLYYKKNVKVPLSELDTFRFHYYDHAACVELKINNKVYRYVIPVLMDTSSLPVFHNKYV